MQKNGNHNSLWTDHSAIKLELRIKMQDIGDGGMEAANHIAMYVPMQQSCMFCTCTPEPKVQLKKKYIYIYLYIYIYIYIYI